MITVGVGRADDAPGRSPARLVASWLAILALVGGAVLGSNVFSVRDRLFASAVPDLVAPASSRVIGAAAGAAAPAGTSVRSAPWWQTVTTLEGAGRTTSPPFTIDRRAIQWRVTWSCSSGHLLVRSSGEPQPVVDAACSQGTGFGERRGTSNLEVTADGPWRLEIAQRIDIPLVEPQLPGMTAPGTTVVAQGTFYKVDRVGAGTLTIYSQADGRYAVRLDDFFVSPNTHLQLRLSTARHPRSSADHLAARSQLLAQLDVTAGSLNYIPPVGLDPTEFASVVIWCPPTNSAYAAADLKGPS